MENDALVADTKELLDVILSHQSSDGDFLGSDVYTFHFIEALNALSPIAFAPYIESAIKWFTNVNDPRDNNPRSVSPFKLQALIGADGCKDFVESSLKKVQENMVGIEGNINLPLGFVESADTYDLFPTFTGISLFLENSDEAYRDIVNNALKWSYKHTEDLRRVSDLGYLAVLSHRAYKKGWWQDKEKLKLIIDKLEKKINDYQNEAHNFQLAYLAYDCSIIGDFEHCERFKRHASNIINFLISKRNDADSFYQNQDRALLDLRLLVAYGSLMTPTEKEKFSEFLLASALYDKVNISRQYRSLQIEASRIAIELKKIELKEEGKGLFVQPHWETKTTAIDPKLIFFLMPFAKDNSPRHLKAIENLFQDVLRNEISQKFSLTVLRADDIFDTRPIMQSIWDAILSARIIVADLTDRNPNVFYEAGLADTLGKDLILISQDIEDVPFDLRHRRVLLYDVNYPGPDKLKQDLNKTISAIIEN